MSLLIVVDMQNDFISGTLGSDQAEKTVGKVAEKIRGTLNGGGSVIFTLDTHGSDYLLTREGEKLPVEHCIKGTQGWELHKKVREACGGRECLAFEKDTFGCRKLAQELSAGKIKTPSEIELVGLCTDICVIANAFLLQAFLPETRISVDASCCAGTTEENHINALKAMKSCQINVTGE